MKSKLLALVVLGAVVCLAATGAFFLQIQDSSGTKLATFGQFAQLKCGSNLTCTFSGGVLTMQPAGGASMGFDAITSGTNSTATMHVGTGASLDATGSGTITATAMPATGLSTTVAVNKGGTGAATFTAHGVLLGNTTSAFNVTAAGTAGFSLRSGGASADPSFGRDVLTSIPSSDTLSAAGTFATTLSLDGTNLAVGSVIEVHAHGLYTTGATASPQMTMQVNAGGTTGVCSTPTVTIATGNTNSVWELACYIQINTTGSPGTAQTWGNFFINSAGGGLTSKGNTNNAAVNFTTGSAQNITIQETGVAVSGQTYQLLSVYAIPRF